MNLRRRNLGAWTSEQLVRVLSGNVAGLALIIAGTFQTNRADETQDALSWLAVGLIGLAVALVGDAVWIFRARERITFARVTLLSGPDAIDSIVAPLTSPRPSTAADRHPESTEFETSRGTLRYHERDCPFLTGRTTTRATREEHEAAGLRPCEVCRP